MIKIRQFAKWLSIFCLTLLPMEAANSVGLWDSTPPDNQTVMILFLWLLGFVFLCFSLYRVLLKSQVRQGVHPHILGYTLSLLGTGGFLLVLFLSLADQIGLGWFIVIGSIYLITLLMWVMLGKALKSIVLFLFIMIVVIAFHLANI